MPEFWRISEDPLNLLPSQRGPGLFPPEARFLEKFDIRTGGDTNGLLFKILRLWSGRGDGMLISEHVVQLVWQPRRMIVLTKTRTAKIGV